MLPLNYTPTLLTYFMHGRFDRGGRAKKHSNLNENIYRLSNYTIKVSQYI